MIAKDLPRAEDCNCFAVRSAARHVTQYYDQFLAPIGCALRNSRSWQSSSAGAADHQRARRRDGDGSHDARAQHPAARTGGLIQIEAGRPTAAPRSPSDQSRRDGLKAASRPGRKRKPNSKHISAPDAPQSCATLLRAVVASENTPQAQSARLT